jgi:hypothetical protein
LRGYDSKAEGDSKAAADMIAKGQKIAEHNDCAWTIIHHPRKQDKSVKAADRPDLFNLDAPVMEWLEEAAGYRALINQTYTRLGFAKPKKQQNSELGLRGFVKGRGEIGPWFLNREYDDSGEPVGYKRLHGIDLLPESDRELLDLLPAKEPMPFGKVLKILYEGNMSRKPLVNRFLKRGIDAGVIAESGKAHTTSRTYTKVEAA